MHNVGYLPASSRHDSAVIEHTNRVIYLEDDDVAAVSEGRLSIHRIKRRAGDYPARAIQTLQMELQQIMKGESEGSVSSVPRVIHKCGNISGALPCNFPPAECCHYLFFEFYWFGPAAPCPAIMVVSVKVMAVSAAAPGQLFNETRVYHSHISLFVHEFITVQSVQN